MRPTLIIVSGLPASGKTTVGRRIATDLRLPFIHRDGLKETLFDSLSWSDRDWSRRLGGASWALLYHVADALLAAGTSFVIESNFDPARATAELREMQSLHPFTPVQVVCTAAGPTLVERYRRRFETGERHPGHLDAVALEEHRDLLLTGRATPLGIAGPVLTLDTTDFATVDYDNLLRDLRRAARVERAIG